MPNQSAASSDSHAQSHLPAAHAPEAQPSGPKGDDPSTAGPGKTDVKSSTPENNAGHLNPSPEDANATPGTLSQK